jgi:hypothetical protein
VPGFSSGREALESTQIDAQDGKDQNQETTKGETPDWWLEFRVKNDLI